MPLKTDYFFIIFFIWLIILTFVFIRFYLFYSKLLKGTKKETLPEVIDSIVNKASNTDKRVDDLHKKYIKLEEDALLHIQKIGLLRFNPFKDTGGDQSFIMALLDAHNTGVVISSLHTRSGTRWYAKRVVKGRGIEYDLSEDEQKVLKEAKFLSKI